MPPKQHSRDNAPPVEGRKKQPPQVTQEKPATREKAQAQAQAHAKHKHKEGTAPNLTPPSNTTTPSKTWLKKQKYAAAAARSRQ
jgi:hypothetical protein